MAAQLPVFDTETESPSDSGLPYFGAESDSGLPDFGEEAPDLSKIKPSPYEALDIASMERGQGKALTGMEPGTELTTALARGAARAFAAVPPTIQSIADFPSTLAGSVGRAKGQTVDQPLVGAERAPQAQEFGQWLQRPLVEIPKLDTSPDTEGFERPGYEQVAREAVNVALSIPEFFESPLGLATMGIGASGKTGATLVRRAFLGDMMKNLVQQYPEMISNWPKMSQSQKIKTVVDLSATAAMAGGLAKPEMAKVSAPFEARTAPEGPVSPEFAPPVSREAPAPMVRAPQLPPMMVAPAPMTAPLPVSADRPEVTGDIFAGRMTATPDQASRIRAFEPRTVPTATETTPAAALPLRQTADAYKAGMAAKTLADLEALAKDRRDRTGKGPELLRKAEAATDPSEKERLTNEALSINAQLPREAIEAATNTGSAIEGPGSQLGKRPLDWREHPEVADWLRKNGAELGIDLPDELKGEAPKPAAPPVETKPPAGATEPASPATPAPVSATEPAAPAPAPAPAAKAAEGKAPTSAELQAQINKQRGIVKRSDSTKKKARMPRRSWMLSNSSCEICSPRQQRVAQRTGQGSPLRRTFAE